MALKDGYFGSLGRAVSSGFNTGLGRKIGISGFRGMATTAGIGAVAGIGLASMSDGATNPIAAGATGAAIGGVALPAAGFAAGAFGATTVGAAKAAIPIGASVGGAAMAATPFVAAVGTVAATRAGSSIWNAGKRMIDWNEGADAFNKVKFTGPITGSKAGWRKGEKLHQKIAGGVSGAIFNGKTVMGGVALAEGVKKAWNTVQTAKMGQNMGIDRLTPRIPSYSDNAGATGDLVFALNANRRG